MSERQAGGQGAAQTEKQLVPKLRFPEFEGEWEELLLGEVGPVLMCKRIFKDDTTHEGDVPFYKIGTFGKEPDAFISREKYNDFKARFSFPSIGEIMISAAGTIGRTVVYDGADAYFQDSNIVWIANDEAKVLNRFLSICYQNIRWTTENNTIARLYNNNLKSKKITIPSLPEQKKIAAFLGAVDEKLAALQMRRDLLTRYKRGLMQKLFSQTLRFTRDDGNPYPDWEEFNAGDVFHSVSNKKHNGELPILAVTQEHGAVLRADLDIDIKSAANSIASYKIVEVGDFIISLRSFQGGIEYSNILGICSPAYTVLKPSKIISSGFYKQYFKKEDFITKLSETVVGIRDGKQISFSAFAAMKLHYPHPEEQQKIATALQAMDAKIDAVAAEIDQIETFKKALLQQMFV